MTDEQTEGGQVRWEYGSNDRGDYLHRAKGATTFLRIDSVPPDELLDYLNNLEAEVAALRVERDELREYVVPDSDDAWVMMRRRAEDAERELADAARAAEGMRVARDNWHHEVEVLRLRVADLEFAQEIRVASIRSLQQEKADRFTKEQVVDMQAELEALRPYKALADETVKALMFASGVDGVFDAAMDFVAKWNELSDWQLHVHDALSATAAEENHDAS